MRRILLLALMLILSGVGYQDLCAQPPAELFYQVSTMTALKKGFFRGYIPYQELKKHGDFGIGTVDGLDGEMVALDSQFYQIRVDGKAYAIPDAAKTPFALVTFFKPEASASVARVHSLAELQDALEPLVPCKELPCAIKVEGTLSRAHVRSVPRQDKPYPDLATALTHQVEFDLRNVRGTLVGFRFPQHMDGVNAAGYHFHLITADKQAGGHVLDLSAEGLRVDMASAARLFMEMPQSCP
jgi:acetolactate decarboxylase